MTKPIFWILWAAMFASLAVYAVLPWIVPAPADPPHAPSFVVVGALLGGATLVGAISLLVRSLALVRPARAGRLDIGQPAGARRWLQVSIALWALAESVGIAGLGLWWIYRQPGLLYPFLAGAALLLVIHAPHAASLVPARGARDPARPGLKIG